MMNKESINKLLSEIKYPGFSRDIVSFGIVKGIKTSENQIILKTRRFQTEGCHTFDVWIRNIKFGNF
mgnify:CR=1 FL=1